MSQPDVLIEVVVILLAVVLVVPLFQRLRIGAVMGYLCAGAAIGPFGWSLVSALEATRALAEIGVVFLLFAAGLELPLERIKVISSSIIGLGIAQIVVTGVVIGAVVVLVGGGPSAAVVIGGGLALSSTAVVVRLLSDRRELATRFGRTALALLLMQDLAVGPLLVCVVALGQETAALGWTLAVAALKAAVAVIAILGLGRLLLRPLFRPVAATGVPGVFTALTLLVVLATGLATEAAGLSMAFGGFLAGMLLAETKYRHQVAAEIRPFRDLLLGLFFVTVGMSIDLALAGQRIGLVALLVVLLLSGKAVILAGLAWLARLPVTHALRLGALLAQGGEFAFVLFGAAVAAGALPTPLAQVLVVSVAITMMLTPAVAELGRRLALAVGRAHTPIAEDDTEALEPLHDHVVIAGFGRLGAAVARRLAATGVRFVAVDMDPRGIAIARDRGVPVYYGDATRPEVLEALHVERARGVVVALGDPKSALQVVTMIRYIFPGLDICARAYDDHHAEALRAAGADAVVPELVATGNALSGWIVDRVAVTPPHPPDGPPAEADGEPRAGAEGGGAAARG